tara:strand:+ start:2087 stop:2287 length:201 start_codon:yes stop_codon:yes gene_type:complete
MRNTRIINNKKVKDLEKPIELKIITLCPSKWLLIDQETGQIYKGTENTEIGKMWELINDKNISKTL